MEPSQILEVQTRTPRGDTSRHFAIKTVAYNFDGDLPKPRMKITAHIQQPVNVPPFALVQCIIPAHPLPRHP